MQEAQRYLYWWRRRREARAYIDANNLRAVASAMDELDRHARLGDHRCAICGLRGALIQALYARGHCLAVTPPGAPEPGCRPGTACPARRTVGFTFLVEGRHYSWRQPACALGFAPEDPGRLRGQHGERPEPTCLLPACRDALMAVVYEYVRRQGVLPAQAHWLPTWQGGLGGGRRWRQVRLG